MKRLILGAAFGCLMSVANARDLGQWQSVNPEVREWYQALMQPDNPAISCCGEADAYWADSFEVDGDKYVAIITDSRPDEPLRRNGSSTSIAAVMQTRSRTVEMPSGLSTLGQRLSFRTIS